MFCAFFNVAIPFYQRFKGMQRNISRIPPHSLQGFFVAGHLTLTSQTYSPSFSGHFPLYYSIANNMVSPATPYVNSHSRAEGLRKTRQCREWGVLERFLKTIVIHISRRLNPPSLIRWIPVHLPYKVPAAFTGTTVEKGTPLIIDNLNVDIFYENSIVSCY